ncbi:MAG: hypothetical protein P1U78_09135 [Alcanivoracaceae bacterium]|nr:hypothetical protein [Alcanivoracaceae bacterium]
MNRRSFIISLLSLAALPAAKKAYTKTLAGTPKALPDVVRKIFDEFPDAALILEEIRQSSPPGKKETEKMISISQDPERIRRHIKKDYENRNCRLISGWLISETEFLCIFAAGQL